jgi:hypothetical protein
MGISVLGITLKPTPPIRNLENPEMLPNPLREIFISKNRYSKRFRQKQSDSFGIILRRNILALRPPPHPVCSQKY